MNKQDLLDAQQSIRDELCSFLDGWPPGLYQVISGIISDNLQPLLDKLPPAMAE